MRRLTPPPGGLKPQFRPTARTAMGGRKTKMTAVLRRACGAIECWLHGSRFDLATGWALSRPATRPVDTYPVRIDKDDVFVCMDASGESLR